MTNIKVEKKKVKKAKFPFDDDTAKRYHQVFFRLSEL